MVSEAKTEVYEWSHGKRPPERDKIETAMESLHQVIQSGDLGTVAEAVFVSRTNRPSAKWSLGNRIIMLAAGTRDARGFNQWKMVGRHVKRGAKAIYILAPKTLQVWDEETQETKNVVNGFRGIPVFRYEDTDGEPLEDEIFNLTIPVEFGPLINELGLEIDAVPFDGVYGYYRPGKIRLATEGVATFFHELTHAVEDKLVGLKPGQHDDQELVAEFSSAVIARLLGYDIPLGNTQRYINFYGGSRKLAQFFKRVEVAVGFVMDRVVVT